MTYDATDFPVNKPAAGLNPSNVVTPFQVDGSGNLKTTGGGGGGGTQYTDGGTPPANPVAGAVMFDKAGVWTDVSVADPLPVTGGGGGTQYTDAGTPPANPVGTALVFDNAGTWKDVSVADAFPVAVENANANGQTTMSASAPVVIASDQTKLPVKAASGDFAASSIADLATLLTLSGAAGDANTVNSFMGRFTKIRDLLLATLTVSVSNGNANGQTTKSASAPVTMASDQGPLTATTGTKTSVGASVTSVTVLASNASAKGRMVYNDSTSILYLDLTGGTASSTSYSVQLAPGAFFEVPGPAIYTGAITGIWVAANGSARVTEFS